MRKMSIIPALALALALASAPAARAHTLWVNAHDSFNHPPGHVMVSLGFGHRLPLDDLLTGDFGVIRLATYELVEPSGKKVPLPMPDYARNPRPPVDGLVVERGDVGVTKVQFTPESPVGAYVLNVEALSSYLNQYVNDKGKTVFSQKPLDQVKDARDVIFAWKYYAYAKAVFSYKEPGVPKPLGHDLEINPLVDVSTLKAGDLLPLEVTFLGKPLTIEGTDVHYLYATSNTFGGPDKFMLASWVIGGRAQFRLPSAGQWVFSIYLQRDVDKHPALADLKGKARQVYYVASLTVDVKP